MFVLPFNIAFLSVESSVCGAVVGCCGTAHLMPLLDAVTTDEVIGKVCAITGLDFC